jgi:tRNA (guanine-N7-)-methyltransferase
MSQAGAIDESKQRAVRSFVLRQGRITPSQVRALDEQWPRYGLSMTDAPCDFEAMFGRCAPHVLEIGFGNGEALLASALAEPMHDFIGIEVHGPGVGRLLHALAMADVHNVRVFRDDAIEVLRRAVSDGALDEVRVFFPDPWPKKKHHKRRIVQPVFAELVRMKLRAGGRLHLATDWPPYAEHMIEVMEVAEGFRNIAGPGRCVERPASRPQTHFERRGLRLGHPVSDLIYEKTVA